MVFHWIICDTSVACNRKDLVGKGVALAKTARSHEDLFNIMSNLISCKANVGKGVIVTSDGHGCVHFCTSHVDTVLAHSCENKVAKDVASNFLNTRKGWSRACVLSCKQRTSSETFQNAWGEHGGKIQMNPKPEKDLYGGGGDSSPKKSKKKSKKSKYVTEDDPYESPKKKKQRKDKKKEKKKKKRKDR